MGKICMRYIKAGPRKKGQALLPLPCCARGQGQLIDEKEEIDDQDIRKILEGKAKGKIEQNKGKGKKMHNKSKARATY